MNLAGTRGKIPSRRSIEMPRSVRGRSGRGFGHRLAGKGNLAVFVADNFSGDFIADFNFVFNQVHPVVGQLADVNHAFFAGQDFDKSAEG